MSLFDFKLQKHRDDLLEEIKSLEKLQENNIQEKKKLLKKIEVNSCYYVLFLIC